MSALALALTASAGCSRPVAERAKSSEASVAATLGAGDDTGFARALEPRDFVFPADHGPHPAFRTEWWYVTGNVETAEGRHFGYQVTFFRSSLAASMPERESDWASDQLYMAHFALTDTAGGEFHAFERFGRGAQGLAGARAEPLRVWLEDWELTADEAGPPPVEGAPMPPIRLRLATPEVAIDLGLAAAKPIVLHGERGLSRKGTAPGNASYYYSFTRLDTRGRVRLADEEWAVSGSSWMDREWSTSVLEQGTVGWDWLSLQLDDGSELMYFTLRRSDGERGYDSGTLVAADGSSRSLPHGELQLEPTRRWTSPSTGTVYPVGWRLSLPAEELELEIESRLPGQELRLTFDYWEGAVTVRGQRGGRPIEGRGYVELTGYGDAAPPRGGTQG